LNDKVLRTDAEPAAIIQKLCTVLWRKVQSITKRYNVRSLLMSVC